MQDEFEEKVFQAFFFRSVSFEPNKQIAQHTSMTKEQLCAKDKNGDYAREEIQQMWCGFQLARKGTF